VWPSDQPRPNASNLNLSTPGQTIPNLVTVPLGADGAVKMYTYGGAHLIADVAEQRELEHESTIRVGAIVVRRIVERRARLNQWRSGGRAPRAHGG